MIVKDKMPDNSTHIYKVETHLHTSQGSACGRNTGAEMAAAYKAAGYCAIIVTDHFFNGNTAVRGNYKWEKKISLFMRGYRDAEKEGKKIGLDVYFGLEFANHGAEFLIYNLDERWLCSHPEIMTDSMESALAKMRGGGGFTVHAHPYRYASYIETPGRIFPEYTDGVEVINKCNSDECNRLALEYAEKYNLPQFSGSDIHQASPLLYGGIAFREKPASLSDIINMSVKGECILL